MLGLYKLNFMRIISLVPSLTELLFDLGLENQIVGITRFCIHPEIKVDSIRKVGGTKTVRLDRVKELQPDLIIANKEENSKTDIEELQKNFRVLLTDIFTLEDTYSSILEIGEHTATIEKAEKLVAAIKREFQTLPNFRPANVGYVIWDHPKMFAGRKTFINHLMSQLNWTNIITDPNSRYPELSPDQINELQPDYILLSSEPFPFKESNLEEWKAAFPNSQVILVDGEIFSWYGSRLLKAPKYFTNLISNLPQI